MNLRFRSLALGGVAALSALLCASNDATACGGCFHVEDQQETTVVTGHRMAFSISPTQTVLWDQIAYAGDPADFAWVLPVKPGAYVELSYDAWFESLDAATSTQVNSPPLNCVQPASNGGSSGCGCGAVGASAGGFSGGGLDGNPQSPPPVSVTHEGSVGPYDTVTLHANVPGSLSKWLTDHKYAIDADVQPIVDAYTADGFDFIALRLQPDKGIKQMKPVRVVSPGASPTLPLRMVSAGTGANVELTLFVIGEGRWETENFPNGSVNTAELSWDFSAMASNYAALRQKPLAENAGRTWLSTYAKQGSLLSEVIDPRTNFKVEYPTDQLLTATSIGELYVFQGLSNGDITDITCVEAFKEYQQSKGFVVDLCPNVGGSGAGGGGGGGAGGSGGASGGGGAGGSDSASCGTLQIGQIDAQNFACGKLDDLSVALTGLHPQDVWVTRLEANLPHDALKEDLKLQASKDQTGVENLFTATTPVNPPCQIAAAAPVSPGRRGDGGGPWGPRRRTELAFFGAVMAALGAALGRRARRPLSIALARAR